MGKTEWRVPIYDDNIFEHNEQSFCGGSLMGSRILVVLDSCDDEVVELLKNYLDMERVVFTIVSCELEENLEDVLLKKGCIERNFEHIINYFGKGIQINCVKYLYFLLQQEILYVTKKRLQYGTICSVVVDDEEDDIQAKAGIIASKSLLLGLGNLVSNYNLIQSGIIASRSVPLEKIVETAIFLSGKYGQMLTGEVIEMKSK